tara:strand:+ start:8082 stop:8216 length:135 start_codon:yes stop_codon:yes gene_type:complete
VSDQIPAYEAPINQRTGMFSRAWFRWFTDLYNRLRDTEVLRAFD